MEKPLRERMLYARYHRSRKISFIFGALAAVVMLALFGLLVWIGCHVAP